MSEETRSMNVSEALHSSQERARQLVQTLREFEGVLQPQQIELRQRGMNLPIGTLDRLDDLRRQLEHLNNNLTGKSIQLRQLRGLAQTTAVINSTLDTDDVLNQVMDTVILLTGAERGYIMLRSTATGEFEFRVARGMDQEVLSEDSFRVSSTITNEVATTGVPVVTYNARDDPRYQGQESIVGYQLRSILAVPLKVGADLIGVVYCDNRVMVGVFGDSELNLLQAFANQAAVAIQNARLFESARAQLAEITEIRELMGNIFASIASGLITLDGDDCILAFNDAAERITGLREAEVVGQPLMDALAPLCEQFDLARVREAGTRASGELRISLNGNADEVRIWNVVITPLRSADGQTQGAVIVLDDMTEQRRREQQLKQVQQYLPSALIENLRGDDLANLRGEAREISVVFADVRGFSTFSELLEPETLMTIINKYLSVASDSINLFEGIVDKYLGDAVTGLFNTQLNPQPDHALRAVRSAMSMVYDVLALHETLDNDERLFYGVGVHTGSAILGNVGSSDRQEFSALGDAFEFAKLLQENAGRGEIILSAATYEQVKDSIECEAVTPHKTKGDESFTVMYRVVGRRRPTR